MRGRGLMRTVREIGRHNIKGGGMRRRMGASLRLGLIAMFVLALAGTACSCSSDETPDPADVPEQIEIDLVEVEEIAGEVDVEEVLAECPTVGPEIVINAPGSGATYQGDERVKVKVTHDDGVKGTHYFFVIPGETADGATYPPTKFCEEDVPEDEVGSYECRLDTSVFPSGSVDSDGNDISGQETPDGPVYLVVIAEADIPDLPEHCDPPRSQEKVQVFIDNHGPDVNILEPEKDEETVQDELHIVYTVEDPLTGMPPTQAIDLYIGGELVFQPPTLPTTAQPYRYDFQLAALPEGPLEICVEAEDSLGNRTNDCLGVDGEKVGVRTVQVHSVPNYRLARQYGPNGTGGLRWTDFGVYEIGGVDQAVIGLATDNGVWVSPLNGQGQPIGFQQLTTRHAEYLAFVESRMGYPFAMVVVEDLGENFALRVYEDPFSSGMPDPGEASGNGAAGEDDPDLSVEEGEEVVSEDAGAELEVVDAQEVEEDVSLEDAAAQEVDDTGEPLDADADGDGEEAEVGGPLYDDPRVVEEHPIEGTVTAAWTGDLFGDDLKDGGALDAIVGTDSAENSLQVFEGDASDESWFLPFVRRINGIEPVESIHVADLNGDSEQLRDIVATRGSTDLGFTVTLQATPGAFYATQNHIPARQSSSVDICLAGCSGSAPACAVSCWAGVYVPADMPGVFVADMLPSEPGEPETPEIVAVSATKNYVALFQRDMKGLPVEEHYVTADTTFNLGAGQLKPHALVGNDPWSVLVADITGDDRLDIVVVNEGSGNVTLMPALVAGQYHANDVTYYNVGGTPHRAWVYDMDQDACPDIVVAHRKTMTYSWLANPGCDGNLYAAVDVPMPVNPDPAKSNSRLKPEKFDVGNVNLLGVDDVLVVTERVPGAPEDAQEDGRLSRKTGYPLYLYLGKPVEEEGIDSIPQTPLILNARYSKGLTGLEIGNVLGTSHLDVVLSFLGTELIQNDSGLDTVADALALAQYTASSAGFVERSLKAVIVYPKPVAITLGKLTTAATAELLDLITVHEGQGTPDSETYEPPRMVSYTSKDNIQKPFSKVAVKSDTEGMGKDPVDVTMGPFRGQGLNDVLTANEGNQDLTLFASTGNGVFANGIPAFSLGLDPVAVTGVYWDADEFIDIVVLTDDNLAIAYGAPGGMFLPLRFFYDDQDPASLGGNALRFSGATDMIVSDANRDCLPDLVVLSNKATVGMNLFIFSSSGDRAPGLVAPSVPVSFPTGSGPVQVRSGHFNADDCEDLAVLNADGDSFTILMNNKCVEGVEPIPCGDTE